MIDTVAPTDSTRAQAAAERPAIAIHNLVVQYGDRRAVDGLSFTVPAGAIFGFLGLNGAGKTTTIKTLLGFRAPAAGSAQVLGYDIVRDSQAIRARVGYVSETNSLYDQLTIPQIIAFCRATSRRWNGAIVDRYIRTFGLPPRARVGQLSKGMKSQLALSLALGGEPDLLILDEPTNGLDPLARHEVLNTLVREIAAEGKTLFFSSHILTEVEAIADWVAIIRDGRLVVCDELDHLKQTQRVLKLTYDQVPAPAEIAALQALPAVARVEQEGRGVRIVARGDVDALAQQLQGRPGGVRHVDAVNLNLEDLFLEYMKDSSEGQQ
ncbi:MAG TPA: ABC transporter ATP-binding protein [Chloroflexia bacterium]|nr:ABC transporter ATP-binding protein [Chloroflexia bacterium]